jgi:hypothetical protein
MVAESIKQSKLHIDPAGWRARQFFRTSSGIAHGESGSPPALTVVMLLADRDVRTPRVGKSSTAKQRDSLFL